MHVSNARTLHIQTVMADTNNDSKEQQQQRQTSLDDGRNDDERAVTVTDPITHLPLTLHDHDGLELEQIPPAASHAELLNNGDEKQKDTQHDSHASPSASSTELATQSLIHSTTSRLYTDPELSNRDGQRRMYAACIAVAAAFSTMVYTSITRVVLGWITGGAGAFGRGLVSLVQSALVPLLGWAVYHYAPIPSEARLQEMERQSGSDPHHKELQRNRTSSNVSSNDQTSASSPWLDTLLAALWPIINPSLFISLSDMLEDQMQATLPPFIHALRVADLGQGSVPAHVLSIRPLPTGEAAKEVEGMQAEEGDFVNLEVCIGYRGHDDDDDDDAGGNSTNAHLLMEFVTVGGVTIPTWISLTSLLLTARIRLQLTPNPPFIALATLSLTGSPHVSFSCTPLIAPRTSRRFMKALNLDVMDIPGLAGWIQSCVREATQGFVAPRSMPLDVKEMLGMGGGNDVDARGVVYVRIGGVKGMRRDGDAMKKVLNGNGKVKGGKGGEKKSGTGDVYVTVGWGKWGKRVWASRVIHDDPHPEWNQETALVVTDAEISAGERLRVQLWDSDRLSADDLMGTYDVYISHLMRDNVQGKMRDREDALLEERDAEEGAAGGGSSPSHPHTQTHDHDHDNADDHSEHSRSKKTPKSQGTLTWSVGYFPKTGLLEAMGGDVAKTRQFEEEVWKEAERKLREEKKEEKGSSSSDAGPHAHRQVEGDTQDGSAPSDGGDTQNSTSNDDDGKDDADEPGGRSEIAQLKSEDLLERTNELIASHPPSSAHPCGILRVWIESIDGLQVENVRGPGEMAGKGVEVESGGLDGDASEGADGADAGGKQEGAAAGGSGTGGDGPGLSGEKASAYCDIVVNCERWYKTRVKVRSGNPYFNAGTERFIRDWKSANVLIAVRDFRLHESHPLLGTVHIPLSSHFLAQDGGGCSHIDASFPLIGGIGFGKLHLKITFRSCTLQLPRHLRGWDVGTFVLHGGEGSARVGEERGMGEVEVVSNDGVGMVGEELRGCKLVVRSVWGKAKLRPVEPETGHAGGGMKWRPKHSQLQTQTNQVNGQANSSAGDSNKSWLVELPIQRRYTECVMFEWKRHETGLSKGIGQLGREDVVAYAVLWLSDLTDTPPISPTPKESYALKDGETDVSTTMDSSATFSYSPGTGTVKLQIYSGSSAQRTRAMFNHTSHDIGEPMQGVVLHARVEFRRGMSVGAHGHKLARKDAGVRNVIEAMGCVDASEGGLDLDGADGDSSSEDSSSDDDSGGEEEESDGGGASSSNPLKRLHAEVKSYNSRKDQLHRQHRGLMQFKLARQTAWVGKGLEKKAKSLGDKVKESLPGGSSSSEDAEKMVGGGNRVEKESQL